MQKLVVFLLVLWGTAASILAAHFYSRETPAPRASVPRAPDDRRPRTREQGLLKRIDQLEAALVAALEPSPEPAADAPPVATRIADLLRQKRELEDGDWNIRDANRIDRKLSALLARDAGAHLALIELLKQAKHDDETHAIVSYLTANPFARMVRNNAVTRKILDESRLLMNSAADPFVREAAARILYKYEPPSREDVVAGIERLNVEPNAGVRETLLELISQHGYGRGLTEEEAQPFLQRLRERMRSGYTWCANALADWSASREDFDRVTAGFAAETDPDKQVDYLNAFRRGTRMAGVRPDQCRALLLDVLRDKQRDADLRDLALSFLKGYAPWDRETADAIREALDD